MISAFLIFNFPKAKMFLGDTGSYIIGFLTGYIFFDLIKNSEFYIAFLGFGRQAGKSKKRRVDPVKKTVHLLGF